MEAPSDGRVVVVVRLVEFGEELLGLRLFAAAVDPAVEFRRAEADAGVLHRAEALRLGLVEADADRGIGAGAGVVEVAAEPAGVRAVVGVAGFPDRGGDEVRAVRVRIADALDDAEIAFLEQRAEEGHRGVQADVVAELDDVLFLLREARPRLVIGVVGVGDQGVEPVVAAGELEHDEDGVVLAGDAPGWRGPWRVVELAEGALDEHRHGPGGGGAENGGAEEVAAGFHGSV